MSQGSPCATPPDQHLPPAWGTGVEQGGQVRGERDAVVL